MKRILVTGSNGYIGAVLTDILKEQHYHVTGIDTKYFSRCGITKTKHPIKEIFLDIRSITESDLKGFDVIIHLAGLSNDPLGMINPRLTEMINYRSTIKLARLAKKAGVRRFIFSSSCSVYGRSNKKFVTERSIPHPLTAYARSKIHAEKDILTLADDHYVVFVLRNPTVCGFSPKFRDDLVVNNLVASALLTGKITLRSDGTAWRPIIDIQELSTVFAECINADSHKINGQICNIGFKSANYQVKDIARLIHRRLPGTTIEHAQSHTDPRSYKVDFSKFQRIFPRIKRHISIEQSIDTLVVHLTDHHFSARHSQSGKYTRLTTMKKLLQRNKLNSLLYWTTRI